MNVKMSLSAIALLVSGSAFCTQEVYVNGKVYTVNNDQPWAEAFAVENGKFTRVGSTEELRKLVNQDTKLVDLNGKFVMPGMIDDHIHPGFGAEMLMNVGTEYAMTYQEFSNKVKQFQQDNPDSKWVYGGPLNWLSDNNGQIEIFNQPSNKSILDTLVKDKPAFFWDVGGHAALVNSKALEMLNITKDTPDPEGGVYVRDANGELTGVLRENAATIVWESFLVDRPSNQEIAYKGIKPVFDIANSFGITGIADAWGREWILKSYGILSKDKALNVRVFAYIADPIEWKSKWMQDLAKEAIKNYRDFNTDRVTVSGVKFVLDGSAGGQTAVMVEPFEGTDNHGYWRDDPDYFIKMIEQYDKQGLTVKFHAVGDGAIRKALEGIGNAREKGSELRHSVAHTVFVNPADKKLFKQHEVVAEFSPYFWYPGPHTEMIKADVGERRLSWVFPFRSLVDKGVHVSVGSDWPVAATPNPWPAIESMMTRKKPGGEGSSLAEQEAISLNAALKAYTLGGAYARYQEDRLGSIEVGKYADFIVTNQNPFAVSPTEIHKTQVLSTVVGGEEVYRAQ